MVGIAQKRYCTKIVQKNYTHNQANREEKSCIHAANTASEETVDGSDS